MRITPSEHGARLNCAFQRLDGEATQEGLWLTSTVPGQSNDRFCVKAVAVGCKHGPLSPRPAGSAGGGRSRTGQGRLTAFPATGGVSVEGRTVRFTRLGLLEEYTVSMDGVQQDFIVLEKPGGAKVLTSRFASSLPPPADAELRLELAVTGARVEQTAYGAQLVLEQSGREIAYSRLKVTDANGKELPARMRVAANCGDRSILVTEPVGLLSSAYSMSSAVSGLEVVVDDTEAVYPVRIDPTFSDANWISLGGIPGANGVVHASVVDGAGNLYIGGSFTQVGDVVANGIAKWNGSTWSALGLGIGGAVGDPLNSPIVYALAVSGSNVYAGGSFTNAGGSAANYIAKWDGSAWSALGLGIGGAVGDPHNSPIVYALAVSSSNVYAGGSFTNAGGSSASYIAKWDGSDWSALGSGMGGVVRALAVSGSDVYAGGVFTIAGGIEANYVAKWDGSTWSALASGVGGAMPFTSGGVYALAVSGSNLYAGGYFTTAGGNPAITIAGWDGAAWSALGSGTGGVSPPPYGVTALAVSGTDVYAGWTTNVGCAAGGCAGGGAAVAKWNGSTWTTLALEPSNWEVGAGITPAVYAMTASGSELFVGGIFTTLGGSPANYIAKWDGSAWSAVGSGMNSSVSAVAVSGTDLYAGGSFTTAGSIAANYIAKWDGNAWSALGSGLDGRVSALAVSGTDLYAGGSFTTAGGIAATNIAKWNGSAWSGLGLGMNDSVSAVAVSGGNLYAGGWFTMAGGTAANCIAKWDGNTWSALGSGLNSPVVALVVSGNNLYAGGFFTTAGGIEATNIAKWNGSAWSALGSGVNGSVSALAVSGGNLYAGGYFTTAGGIAATNVAKWNGSAWSALGSGVDGGVYALAVSGTDLYAGGSFTTAGSISANYIAKWDGNVWSALGSGVGGAYASVYALAVSGGDLYAGGSFTTAGGKVSAYAAKAIIAPFYFITTNGSVGLSNGQFYFTLVGPAGSNAVVFASTNLQTWVPLATNPLSGGSFNFTDTLATDFPRRFYRALLQP